MTEEITAPSPSSTSNSVRLSILDLPKLARKISGKKTISISDPKNDNDCYNESKQYLIMFAAEVIGTALLLFVGCTGCIVDYENKRPDIVGAFAFGITVMLIIQVFGHISGAHLNPGVTIATVLLKRLTLKMAIVYIIAQFVGATLGFGLLKILVSDDLAGDGFCMTKIHPQISIVQAFAIELIITTILIMVCCSVWDKRNEKNTDSTPVRFGLVIVILSQIFGPLTGASMNTARSFAPIVIGGNWDNAWVYFVAPNLAPFLGCGIYKFMFTPSEEIVESESAFLNADSSRPPKTRV